MAFVHIDREQDQGHAASGAELRAQPTAEATGSEGAGTSASLLRWPAERGLAECLQARGLPFLLLVGESEAPPVSGYRFMDWVRSPLDCEELLVRLSSLEERFVRDREGRRPRLDDADRLSFGRASVELAPAELAIVRALLAVYRDVLSVAEVRAALGVEHCDSYDVFASRLVRLRRKLGKVGLRLTRAGHVGYSLEPAPS